MLGSVRDGRFCDRVAMFMKRKLESANHDVTVLGISAISIR